MAEQGQRGIADWASLPRDICGSIMERLLLHDITRFQCVCKAWRAVPCPRVQSPIKFPVPKSQWLMTVGSGARCKFFHPACKEPYIVDIPELDDARIFASKGGWLLLLRGDWSFSFLNSFTKQSIKLPNFPRHMVADLMTFTSSPLQQDCMVFGASFAPRAVHIAVIRRGQGQWKAMVAQHNLPFQPSNCNATFCDGMFYCLGVSGNLGVFNPDSISPTWEVCGPPNCPQLIDCEDSCRRSYLVESDGSIIAVFTSSRGDYISIYRLDDAKVAWERLQTLGDRMLFLGSTTSLSARRVIPGMENKVYLEVVKGEEGSIVFYPMGRAKSFHVFGQVPSPDLHETRIYLDCTWIEPNVDIHSIDELVWGSFDHDSEERPVTLFHVL